MIYYASWQHKLKTCMHKIAAGNEYEKADTHIRMQSHKTMNIPQNYSTQRWLGSRVVSVLDSGAVGPGFKSQPRRCRVSLRQAVRIHCTSVQQAAKLVAALLRVAGVTAGLAKVVAAYRRVYDSRHLQTDYKETGSAIFLLNSADLM